MPPATASLHNVAGRVCKSDSTDSRALLVHCMDTCDSVNDLFQRSTVARAAHHSRCPANAFGGAGAARTGGAAARGWLQSLALRRLAPFSIWVTSGVFSVAAVAAHLPPRMGAKTCGRSQAQGLAEEACPQSRQAAAAISAGHVESALRAARVALAPKHRWMHCLGAAPFVRPQSVSLGAGTILAAALRSCCHGGAAANPAAVATYGQPVLLDARVVLPIPGTSAASPSSLHPEQYISTNGGRMHAMSVVTPQRESARSHLPACMVSRAEATCTWKRSRALRTRPVWAECPACNFALSIRLRVLKTYTSKGCKNQVVSAGTNSRSTPN